MVQESRRNHFVPNLLLREWLVDRSEQKLLQTYQRDPRTGALLRTLKSLNGVCYALGLLTLHTNGFRRDALERVFFQEVDTKGAAALALLLEHGPEHLDGMQRCDFPRLLLSLDVRQPSHVKLVRAGADHLRTAIDADEAIHAELIRQGVAKPASAFLEEDLGRSLEDRMLLRIQKLVDNPEVGGRLINAAWGLRKLPDPGQSLLLSDRPLIRVHSYDSPGATWVLPLNPRVAFIAANHPSNLDRLMHAPAQHFVERLNVSSVRRAERYVFTIETGSQAWLEQHLQSRG